MSLTYGFYNSVAHDRAYDAVQISSIFDGVIGDGVFMSIGNALNVIYGTGMQVKVGIGRAWFNHTWTYNDTEMNLTIDSATPGLNRIDVVVLEVDASESTRANSIKVVKGTAGTNPVPPTLTNTELVHQHPLAHVYVPSGTTQINQGLITNKIGTSDCPYVTGLVDTVNIDDLIAEWDAEWAAWVASQTTDFDAWFQEMKDQLTTDAAGALQVQINSHNHSEVQNTKIINGGIADNAVNAAKIANRTRSFLLLPPETWDVDAGLGTTYNTESYHWRGAFTVPEDFVSDLGVSAVWVGSGSAAPDGYVMRFMTKAMFGNIESQEVYNNHSVQNGLGQVIMGKYGAYTLTRGSSGLDLSSIAKGDYVTLQTWRQGYDGIYDLYPNVASFRGWLISYTADS